MRVWRLVVLRCSLEGGMQIHTVLACLILTPPRHRNPCSAKSAERSVGNLQLVSDWLSMFCKYLR